jgi:hypothetical protein
MAEQAPNPSPQVPPKLHVPRSHGCGRRGCRYTQDGSHITCMSLPWVWHWGNLGHLWQAPSRKHVIFQNRECYIPSQPMSILRSSVPTPPTHLRFVRVELRAHWTSTLPLDLHGFSYNEGLLSVSHLSVYMRTCDYAFLLSFMIPSLCFCI